jgi:hypothetical protein
MASVRVRHTTTLASGSSNCIDRDCAKTNGRHGFGLARPGHPSCRRWRHPA